MYWDFNGWACNPVPGPQDAQRRVAIIVTTIFVDLLKHHTVNALSVGPPGGGTPSLKVVGRIPGTHGLKSLWAPKKGGQISYVLPQS